VTSPASPIPEQPPQPCCKSRLVRVWPGEREVRVELVSGAGAVFLKVRAFCASCGAVVQPRGVAGRVAKEVLSQEQRSVKYTVAADRAIGQTGTWSSLNLPPWNEVGDLVEFPRVARGSLWDDYKSPMFNDLRIRRARMANLVGLTRQRKERTFETPGSIGSLNLTLETVNHVLDSRYAHRQDADHLRFWPLIAATAARPVEAWECENAEESQDTAIALLGVYQVGIAIRNHIVVVKKRTGWIITAYALSSPERAIKARDGKLLYASYATPEKHETPG
jgi:hypothetical protein